jgi:sugar lactone lactonase YvrE
MARMLPLFAAWLAAWATGVLQSSAAPPAAPLARKAFVLPVMTGLVEGIAYRAKTGAYYFGDVRQRVVWLRTPDGRVTRFSPPDDRLLGVFRLEVDEARGALWLAMGALPQMEGFTEAQKGAGGLAELDLATGQVRRVVLAPADGAAHLLGDLVVARDGTIYATDTTAPVVWKLAPGGRALEVVVRDRFTSLQGITPSADGRTLFVTDYPVGVLAIELASAAVRTLTAPAGINLRGCDTLARAPDGTLIAIQNGTKTQRVLRLALDAGASAITSVETIAEDPAMADATLGTIAGDAFVFIADGGWNRFEPGKVDATPRPVPVLSVLLTGVGR